jgi:nicotinate phosphoribosyltransferase
MIQGIDFCQIMAMAGFLRSGKADRIVTCEAVAERLPPRQRFLVMAGTEEIREALASMRFDEADIGFLRRVPAMRNAMTPAFEKWLRTFRFTGDMWAMAEGEIVFPGEPLVRITAPLPQAQVAEAVVLSILGHDIGVASRAARIALAAQGRPVVEFGTCGTRHGVSSRASRAAYLAGFAGTSNAEAGLLFGIPVVGAATGTWVAAHRTEAEALGGWAALWDELIIPFEAQGTPCVAETMAGIGDAAMVLVDSVDLLAQSRLVRHILDKAGSGAGMAASGDLDEHSIHGLVSAGAPIDRFHVGPMGRMVVPPRIAYVAVHDETEARPLPGFPCGKAAMPGRKQVFLDQREGGWIHLVALDGEIEPSELLSPLMDCHIRSGSVVDGVRETTLEMSRRYCNAALASLSALPIGYDLSSISEPSVGVPVRAHESLIGVFMDARCGLGDGP